MNSSDGGMSSSSKIHEIRSEDVVLEIYQRNRRRGRSDSIKIYFDVVIVREFVGSSGESNRTQFVQQKDLRDIHIVVAKAQKWIADKHRELRA
jgi:hypothetical protein